MDQRESPGTTTTATPSRSERIGVGASMPPAVGIGAGFHPGETAARSSAGPVADVPATGTGDQDGDAATFDTGAAGGRDLRFPISGGCACATWRGTEADVRSIDDGSG